MPRPRLDDNLFLNHRFGQTEVKHCTRDGRGVLICTCLCDCGVVHVAEATRLRSGNTRSCGCLIGRSGYAYESRKLWKVHKRLYNIWKLMVGRCTKPESKDWPGYGGRGIRVCSRWLVFSNFQKDMGDPPSKLHTLDRINNNGNYEPKNCRWATMKEQCRNRRSSVYLKAFGKLRTMVEWSELSGLSTRTISARISKMGMTPEESLALSGKKAKGYKPEGWKWKSRTGITISEEEFLRVAEEKWWKYVTAPVWKGL